MILANTIQDKTFEIQDYASSIGHNVCLDISFMFKPQLNYTHITSVYKHIYAGNVRCIHS